MYNNFAYIYDKLMYDVDYEGYKCHIMDLMKNCKSEKPMIADLGCGTGSICVLLAKEGYDMIGIDISEDMLAVAKEKAEENQVEVLFLNQDMTEFELYGTVDACISMLDSINYIQEETELDRLFYNVSNYLNPNGIFCFDMNTPYKLEHVLGDNVFYEVGEDFTYIWQNYYDKENRLCDFELTFFERVGENYVRFDELQCEKAWSVEEIKCALERNGLQLERVYSDFSYGEITQKCERIFYLARKV